MSGEPTKSEQSSQGEAVSPTRVGETARQLIRRAKRASRSLPRRALRQNQAENRSPRRVHCDV
jgi:hypothetical protein